ncbi:MAG: hypothetical protein U0794_02375 [Isosphaeraceae bacterium]
MPPAAGKEIIDQQVETLKSKSRVDIKKDILAHIGPKMVAYIMPGGPAAKPGANEGLGGLTGLMGGAPLNPASLAALGSTPVPRVTLVAEVDNAEAFGKALDSLMIAVNQQLRARAAEMAEAAEAAAGANDPNAQPGAAEGEPRGREGRGAGGRSPEMRPRLRRWSSSSCRARRRACILIVPSSLSKSFPAGLQAAIRLGAKHVVIATTADAAYPRSQARHVDAAVGDQRGLRRTAEKPDVPGGHRPAFGHTGDPGVLPGHDPARQHRPGLRQSPCRDNGERWWWSARRARGPWLSGFQGADLGGGGRGAGVEKGNVLSGAPAGAYPGGSGCSGRRVSRWLGCPRGEPILAPAVVDGRRMPAGGEGRAEGGFPLAEC